jgi:hypothetical protein
VAAGVVAGVVAGLVGLGEGGGAGEGKLITIGSDAHTSPENNGAVVFSNDLTPKALVLSADEMKWYISEVTKKGSHMRLTDICFAIGVSTLKHFISGQGNPTRRVEELVKLNSWFAKRQASGLVPEATVIEECRLDRQKQQRKRRRPGSGSGSSKRWRCQL